MTTRPARSILLDFFRLATPTAPLAALGVFWAGYTPIAVTLLALSLASGITWRILSRTPRSDSAPVLAAPGRGTLQQYNIFREMEPGLRRRFALAVFLMFSTLGPLSILMGFLLH
jgi:hypothetical protein